MAVRSRCTKTRIRLRAKYGASLVMNRNCFSPTGTQTQSVSAINCCAPRLGVDQGHFAEDFALTEGLQRAVAELHAHFAGLDDEELGALVAGLEDHLAGPKARASLRSPARAA